MELIKPVVAAYEKIFSNLPFSFQLYSLAYKNILKKEIGLANIHKGDRVLNIGCGAMPFSSVYIARLTKALVWGIDYDKKACQEAQLVVEKLGLSDKITISVADGRSFACTDFNVVLIALQAEPKKEILDNLFQKAKTGTRFILRKPRDIFLSQYEQIPEDYLVIKEVKQKMLTFNRSVLVRKGG